jgi:hypothetical protein
MATQSFHPCESHPSVPITPEVALQHLQAYLEATTTTAYLHPNAKLTVSGPQADLSSGSLTIHNLKRVEAGLKGEFLAPSLELEGSQIKEKGYGKKTTFEDAAEVVAEAMDVDDEGEWQDKEEFEREQEDIQGDIGPRNPVVEGVPVEVQVPEGAKIDKEARKREKKERMKAEKKAKNEKK